MISAQPPDMLACSRQSEYALLCEANGGCVLDMDIQRKVWAVSRALNARDDVLEVVPGMNNFLVIFHSPVRDFDARQSELVGTWRTVEVGGEEGKVVTVPVVYGGPTGEDLDLVVQASGLSREAYISLHAQGTYTVYALGSQPGFAYLGGLDARLAVPRRAVPRPRVEEGSVIIGGNQAGILSRTTPSGWHIIGRTDLRCFDHTSAHPALFDPGDIVRFTIQEVLA